MRKLALAAAALLLAACTKDIQNPEAVRAGVMDYLRTRSSQTGLNMDMMQVDVTQLSFEKNQARATVSFRPKTGEGGAIRMSYTLDRKGDQWVVEGHGASSGENPHGENPHGSNPHGGSKETPQALPQSPQALPPGHPPVSPKQ